MPALSRLALTAALIAALAMPPMLALLVLGPAPARAEGASPADAAAIRKVIEAQLDAFRHDDGARAFSFAAPEIQQLFGSPEAFMAMVRTGYAPVYRPRQVFFQPLLVQGGQWVQPLLITAQDGRVLIALYEMERQPDGVWRIGGVRLLPAAAQGA
jgi:Domain of unknown function (DUF4864)